MRAQDSFLQKRKSYKRRHSLDVCSNNGYYGRSLGWISKRMAVRSAPSISMSEKLRFDVGVDYAKGKDIEQPVAATFGVSYQW